MAKVGYMKYQGFIGPFPDSPEFTAWWQADKAESERVLAEAKATGNVRVVKLMQKQIRQANEALAGRAAA